MSNELIIEEVKKLSKENTELKNEQEVVWTQECSNRIMQNQEKISKLLDSLPESIMMEYLNRRKCFVYHNKLIIN